MRLYETTFITDAQYSESEIETEIKKVEELITSNGGEIVETQRWGIRRLAYEIKHKRQGFYTHFLYRASTRHAAADRECFQGQRTGHSFSDGCLRDRSGSAP